MAAFVAGDRDLAEHQHRTAAALGLTMVLGGLWHGAAWTFVVCGLIHGVMLVIEHFLRTATKGAAWKETLPVQLVLCAVTYVIVCIAWVFFRAADFPSAAMILGAIPLALASGAGAESRQQIGWVIVGGMSLGTLLTIFVVTTVYTLFARKGIPGEITTPEALEPVAHGAE